MARDRDSQGCVTLIAALIGAAAVIWAANIGREVIIERGDDNNTSEMRSSAPEIDREATIEARYQATIAAMSVSARQEPIVRESPPTEAPAPVEPTRVPQPTAMPLPTAVPDTPPGTVLSVGETWRQGGIELALSETSLRTAGVRLSMQIRNKRNDEVVISYNSDNFYAMGNDDNRYAVMGDSRMSTAYGRLENSFILQPGGEAGIGGPYDYIPLIEVALADTMVTELILTATGISSISEAKWRIPVSR